MTNENTARFAVRAVAVTLMLFVVIEWAYGWTALGWSQNHGDLTIYTDATRRLFAGGSWYLDRQTGSYDLLFGDVLYPPVAAVFFLPWLVLPGWTFVVIPALIVGWSVRNAKPWQWILIALCLLWPATGIKVLSANPSVWIAAFVALGLRYRWPAALVLLKPSVFPLSLIGIRHRDWWTVLAVLLVLSVWFLPDTLRYPAVVFGARGGGLLYNLADLPVMLIPLCGYLGHRDLPAVRAPDDVMDTLTVQADHNRQHALDEPSSILEPPCQPRPAVVLEADRREDGGSGRSMADRELGLVWYLVRIEDDAQRREYVRFAGQPEEVH